LEYSLRVGCALYGTMHINATRNRMNFVMSKSALAYCMKLTNVYK